VLFKKKTLLGSIPTHPQGSGWHRNIQIYYWHSQTGIHQQQNLAHSCKFQLDFQQKPLWWKWNRP